MNLNKIFKLPYTTLMIRLNKYGKSRKTTLKNRTTVQMYKFNKETINKMTEEEDNIK